MLSHAANIAEQAGANALLLDAPAWLWQRLEKILADEGYTGEEFRIWVKQTFNVELDIAQRSPDHKGFIPRPSGWAWSARWLDHIVIVVSTRTMSS